ncbi:MAG: type I-F CRISPR-associated endoribonuclease Cas6/Csy4 [Cellvibrionaceae bacterium]|nr:type I-F CRISPR-associated endoribonuclease Cas6/Csy4 [Cellvibrionaceae bacterium]
MALVKTNNHLVGVSFPQFAKTLGEQLRLHGPQNDLQALVAAPWFNGLTDYCQMDDIRPTPASVQYRTVRRVQTKSAANKRKRSVAKGWLNTEEAMAKIPATAQRSLTLPYLQLNSGSTGQHMRIFIEHGPLQSEPSSGRFNTYGLSSTATIPWF